jgi:hypothetical protein
VITADLKFRLGFSGQELHSSTINLSASAIGGVSGPYGTRHLLRMGQHFDHYYDRRRTIPIWEMRKIYSRLPNFKKGTKSHSNDVTGQIGECSGALIMRSIIGLSTRDLRPLIVDANRKTPDFCAYLNPRGSMLTSLLPTNLTLPNEWPLESKSTPGEANSKKGFYEALQQIATYWLLRGPQEPSVIGFGLISVAHAGMKKITLHVVVPTNAPRITEIINDLHRQPYSKDLLTEFQKKFKKPTFETRTYISDC